jgi:hypothetical protein
MRHSHNTIRFAWQRDNLSHDMPKRVNRDLQETPWEEVIVIGVEFIRIIEYSEKIDPCDHSICQNIAMDLTKTDQICFIK